MYKRILVPVSHGPFSDRGVLAAIRLGRTANASLRFIHVVDEAAVEEPRAGFRGAVEEYLGLLETVDRDRAAAVLGPRSQAEAAGVDFEVVVRSSADGAPCELVALEALGWGADVIVMGAEAGGGAGLRPGSHGARILQSSPVPVMVISARGCRP